MAVHPHQIQVAKRFGTTGERVIFKGLTAVAGIIKSFSIRSDTVAVGDVVMDVRIDGVSIYDDPGDRLKLVAAQTDASQTGLSYAVTKGQGIDVRVVSMPPFSVIGGRFYVQVDIDDQVPGTYAGESTTELTIGTGTKVLNSTEYLSYLPGTSIRISDQANPLTNYMAGTVTAVDGLEATVDVTTAVGSGTISAWNLSVSGAPGPAGPTGPQGPPGSGSFVREEVVHVTASLDDLEEGEEEIELGKVCKVLSVESDKEIRLRSYVRADKRTADSTRPLGTVVSGSHGNTMELRLTTAMLPVFYMAPPADLTNLEDTPTNEIPFLVQNLSGVSGTVTLTFTILREEL